MRRFTFAIVAILGLLSCGKGSETDGPNSSVPVQSVVITLNGQSVANQTIPLIYIRRWQDFRVFEYDESIATICYVD